MGKHLFPRTLEKWAGVSHAERQEKNIHQEENSNSEHACVQGEHGGQCGRKEGLRGVVSSPDRSWVNSTSGIAKLDRVKPSDLLTVTEMMILPSACFMATAR